MCRTGERRTAPCASGCFGELTLEDGADQEDQRVGEEHRASPEPVGEPSEERAADEDADQRRGADQALHQGGEVEIGGEGRHRHADAADDVAVDALAYLCGGRDRWSVRTMRRKKA